MDDIGSHGLAGEAADFGESYAIPRNRGPPSAARACGAGPGNQPPLRRGPNSPTETVRRALLVAAVSIQSARDPDARGTLLETHRLGIHTRQSSEPTAVTPERGGDSDHSAAEATPLCSIDSPRRLTTARPPRLEYSRQPLAKSTSPCPILTLRTNHEARAAIRSTSLACLRYAP